MQKKNKSSKAKYQVKLNSGRVIGPVRLDRIKKLIQADQILGTEMAREHPMGEWVDINQLSPIADLLISQIEGNLGQTRTVAQTSEEGIDGYISPYAEDQGTTMQIPSDVTLHKDSTARDPVNTEQPQASDTSTDASSDPTQAEDHRPLVEEQTDATIVVTPEELAAETNRTRSQALQSISGHHPSKNVIQDQDTVIMNVTPLRQSEEESAPRYPKKKKGIPSEKRKLILYGLFLILLAMDVFFEDDGKQRVQKFEDIRVELPRLREGSDVQASSAKYQEAITQYYVLDHMQGYRNALNLLKQAIYLDSSNSKAYAMLASCYIHLVEFAPKTPKFFSTVTKLIELSRGAQIDLAESAIAESEYYSLLNQSKAAEKIIVEFTRDHKNFGAEMFLYLAQINIDREQYNDAARYLNEFPDDSVFTAKVFYLRGFVAEKLGSFIEAEREYKRAIEFNATHAKSRIRLAGLQISKGATSEATGQVAYLDERWYLLSRSQAAEVLFLKAKLFQIERRWKDALAALQKAVQLDPKKTDYRIEFYALLGREGGDRNPVMKNAQMYYFIGKGEESLAHGRYQESVNHFLEARNLRLDSSLPLHKLGDAFFYMNDIENARFNYEKASQLGEQNLEILSKYIRTLILSYDWEESQKVIQQLEAVPTAASKVDALKGDLFLQQKLYAQSIVYFERAIAKEIADPRVYFNYAEALRLSGRCKEAGFFYAMSYRMDPVNARALVQAATCLADTKSISRGVEYLVGHLSKVSSNQAEIYSGLAELEMKRGDYDLAKNYVERAFESNPDFAYAWYLRGKILMNQVEQSKETQLESLSAFKQYSDRNASDPRGYLERYQVYIQLSQFDKAEQELDKIYKIYPKYPNLHYYRGSLFSAMGNVEASLSELVTELDNHPRNLAARILLGKELIKAKYYQQALEQFNTAMQSAPKSSEAKHLAGYASYLLRNFKTAIALFEAALQLDKGNPIIYKRLGLAYYESGDKVSASQAFRRYLQLAPDAPDRTEVERFL